MKKNNKGTTTKAKKAPIITIIIIIVLFVGAVTGMVINGTAKAKESSYPDWYFYDQYVEKYQPTNPLLNENEDAANYEDGHEILPDVDSKISNAFAAAKTVLREKFGKISTLNWERFDAATIVEGKDLMVNQWDASWDPNENTVHVWQLLKAKSDKDMEAVIAHELIHSLTYTNGERSSILYEGLTEYMSVLLYGEKDYIAYELPVRFVQLYAEAYGLEKAIELFSQGDCISTINALIPERSNVMGNIDGLLGHVSKYVDRGAYTVVLDVLAHFCKNLNGDKELIENLVEKYLEDLNPDTNAYYSAVLRR